MLPHCHALWQQGVLLLVLLLWGSCSSLLQGVQAQRTAIKDLCVRSRVCNPQLMPTGYSINYNKQKKETGITITTSRVNACSQEQQAEDNRATQTCFCHEAMIQWLKKSPALVQPASLSAPSQFNGLGTAVLDGTIAATECMVKAANVTPTDVNRADMVEQLQDQRSVKTLAGISSYYYIRFPILLVEGYGEFLTYAVNCLQSSGPAAATVSKAQDVPLGCQGMVSWLSSYADVLAGESIKMKNDVIRQFYDYLETMEVGLGAVERALKGMLDPQSWRDFLQNAQAAASTADMPCDEPAICFGGVLAGAWAELSGIPAGMNGDHPALAKLKEIRTAMAQFKTMTSGVLCDDQEKLLDLEHSQFAIYNAFWAVMSGIKDLSADTLIRLGPEVLTDIMVQYAGFEALQGLEVPAFTLRDLVSALSTATDDAMNAYNSRYKKGMYKIASTQTTLLAFLQGGSVIGNNFCPDGRIRQQCPINRCIVPPDAPSLCGSGQLCITDGCADCSTSCTPAPPTNADATNALQLLKSWLDLLRSSDGLQKGTQPLKDTMPGLVKSLDYLYSQGKSPGDRTYMYQSGLLTFSRQVIVTAAVPCPQGTAQTCYKYKRFKACKVFPKPMASCKVTQAFDVPNGFIPWVAIHSGLSSVLYSALDLMSTYYAPGNATHLCSIRR